MAASQIPLTSQLVRQDSADFPLASSNDVQGAHHVYADSVLFNAAVVNSPSLFIVGMLVTIKTPTLITQQITNLSPLTLVPFGEGGLPAFSGSDGAAVVEDGNPTPSASFRRLTFDDIDPAFSITSFTPGFVTTKELGDTIVNPNFTASYNAAVISATLDEDVTPGPLALLTPFTAFAYGTAPLPPRAYSKSTINGTVTWTLAATKAPSGPVKLSSIVAAWRARRFVGLSVLPGAYDEAFIEGLASSALASGFSGVYAFGSGGGTQRIYLCWPTGFGNPASIKDQNGFVFPMTKVATAVPVTNAFAVLVPGGYDVYESGITVAPFTLTVT